MLFIVVSNVLAWYEKNFLAAVLPIGYYLLQGQVISMVFHIYWCQEYVGGKTYSGVDMSFSV